MARRATNRGGSGTQRPLRVQRAALTFGALCAFAPGAAACPSCGAAGQGLETLVWILGFLVIPYVIVSGVWFWMKRVLASEHRE